MKVKNKIYQGKFRLRWIVFTIWICLVSSVVNGQIRRAPYPIIFVHGYFSSNLTWNTTLEFLGNYWGTHSANDVYHVVLNAQGDVTNIFGLDNIEGTWDDDVLDSFPENNQLSSNGSLFAINFKNFWDKNTKQLLIHDSGSPGLGESDGNESAIFKQGYALRKMIQAVLESTDMNKVILVGHSMGGLAAREYLQRTEAGQHKWWIDPTLPDGHKVAKLVTIGTPHLGTNVSFLLTQFIGANEYSEARRDLRWSFINGMEGVYLFGGSENEISDSYHNIDVNCNGLINLVISGINDKTNNTTHNYSMPLPSNIEYTWITSDHVAAIGGDFIVDLDRQWLYDENSNPTPLGKADTLLTHRHHLDETSDFYSILRGLDEPDSYDLAYELSFNRSIIGFITFQTDAYFLDVDFYKIEVPSAGILSVLIDDNFDEFSGITQLAILDEDQNTLTYSPINSFPTQLSYQVTPGTHYIRVRGNATSSTWEYPYILKVSSDIYPNWSIFPDFETEGFELEGEYVYIMDSFNGTNAYLNSASNGGFGDNASYYQCTEYVARYLHEIYDTDYTDTKNLGVPTQGFQGFDFHPDYYSDPPLPKVDMNGNTIKLKNNINPKPGDVYIDNNVGHSAIIKSVNGDNVFLIEQNWIWNDNGIYKYTTNRFIDKNSSGLYFYGFNYTGWFEGDIWADNGSSQAIFDAYIRNGDAETLGFPFDNGGGMYVHDYYFLANDQEIHVLLQDFDSEISGQTTICYQPEENTAYLLKGCLGFLWWEYQSLLGAPTSDEINDVNLFPEKERNDGFDIMQTFQFGQSFWDRESGLVRINCYSGTCEEDGISACLPGGSNSISNSFRILNSNESKTCSELLEDLYPTDLSKIEYFFDVDPGFGNGIAIPIAQGAVVNVQTTIDLSNLSTGLHRLYLRAMDETGKWGIPQSSSVLVQESSFSDPLPDVAKIEYFFDSDPGLNNGTGFTFSQANTVEISQKLDLSTIEGGLHRLYIRAQDTNGNWGIPQAKSVLVQPTVIGDQLSNIAEIEYFFDVDPTEGNGTDFSFTPDDTVDIQSTIDLAGIPPGLHRLYIRAKDESGQWGIPQAKSVLVQPTVFGDQLLNIAEIEYFFDADPSPGNGTDFSFTPDTTVDIQSTIGLSSLPLGLHRFYVRAKDGSGQWGIPQAKSVLVQPTVVGDQLQNIAEIEYFFDSDPNPGNGTGFSFTPETKVDIQSTIDLASLPTGLHRLYLRAKDDGGQWGVPQAKSVLVQQTSQNDTLPDIVGIEYFFHSDPGFGNGSAFQFESSNEIIIDSNVSLAQLDLGDHSFYVRALDSNGVWGIPQFHEFAVSEMPQLLLLENGGGQVTDMLTGSGSVSSTQLFRFGLTATGEAAFINSSLTLGISAAGITTSDFANIQLIEDVNNNGSIETGENPVGTIENPLDISNGITISSFTVPVAKTGYIFKGDVNNLVGGNQLNISLPVGNITDVTGVTSGLSITPTGLVSSVNHIEDGVPGLVFRVERTTGDVFFKGTMFENNADIAERIKVSEPVEPGDVVELDPDKAGYFRKARRNSKLIAGIITSEPGFVLGNKDIVHSDSSKPDVTLQPSLALMGRVPVKATTENGPILPGDLLTVSKKPGFAKRCTNPKKCEGAIVGKALESLKSGEGLVLVLVMRW